ncbi:CYR1 [Cyberlindnera jadinii]|uniref:CYR1 protein n=2 Tax=Cyberlindnera jadinii (strain ATCC 18201 / CBS 1600 / BCRC 20928 / JCM 3617 / NBRC 0987 / NRRL Y-1542) TaxID=983966 RepID=A0A0H5CD47_CYBJN|nr:CYR1 [Cyberlindnera jadinii]
MPGFDSDYSIHPARDKNSTGSEGDVSPLTSRKVSLAENKRRSSGDSRSQSLGSSDGSRLESVTSPSGISKSYKGFHQMGQQFPQPPFKHPVKPKHKKSIFGKFITSIREEKKRISEDISEKSSIRSASQPLQSIPRDPLSKSKSQDHTELYSMDNSTIFEEPIRSNGLTTSKSLGAQPPHRVSVVGSSVSSKLSGGVSLNKDSVAESVVTMNIHDLDVTDIVGHIDPSDIPERKSPAKDGWAAPESWDVKPDKPTQVSHGDEDEYVVAKTSHKAPLKGMGKAHHNKLYHIRVHAEDDDFASTLKRPYDETAEEIIRFLKGRYQLVGDYKLSLRVGKVTKKLESYQRPVKIQTNLLLLSGYTEADKMEEIGRFDLTYLFKFILHHDVLKQLTPTEEEAIGRDLVHVNLKSKDLQKIPALCYSSKVQSLDVSNNGDITLPLDFFQMSNSQLSSLRMVNIRAKYFPQNVVYARELVSLDLERNFITSIPENISFLKNLSILNMSCNKLSYLPDLPESLKILDLSSNEFEEYPESVNKLTNLLQLDLSYNKLRTLPESINNLKSIKKINISSNYLTKVEIRLTNLRALNLRHNDIFSIRLPGSNVENLYLSNNNISNISDPLRSLRALDLQANPITQLSIESPNLISLNLSKAKLTAFPTTILNHTKLEKLELSHNALRQLPDISNLTSLRELSLYSNNLEQLPDMSSLTKLKVLDLHDNNLKLIPDFSFVESINLSSNLISELPEAAHNKALHIWAADNQLDESCFDVLKQLTDLKTLDLSYNKLIDIPQGVFSTLHLIQELYLAGNSLSTLPDDFDELRLLRVLHLNSNRFRTLPAGLSKLADLEVVDIGSNDLKYNTSNSKYEWNWKNNTNLRYLNLSGNKKMEITEDLEMPKLKLLGLMDLTITMQVIPDDSMDFRVRVTPTTLDHMSYGISDKINKHITTRDSVFQNINGGTLICLFDGLYSGKISYLIKDSFHKLFENELKKLDVPTAMRSAFLQLNGVINNANLNSEDGLTGSTATVVYLKEGKAYCANIGDTMVMIAKPDGSYSWLSVLHQPSIPAEFDRIRTSGGFVSSNDRVDGISQVSRAAGFIDLLPHVHTGPDSSECTINDDVLVIASKELYDYLPVKTIGDIVRESDNPMVTAERLRDYAISYGCSTKVSAIVVSTKKAKKKSGPVSRQLVQDSNLRRLRPEIEPPSGELAMVFTDIKNSTLLWENYPLAMRSAIRSHNDIMRRQLHIVGGYEVKTEGDAFMVSFPTVTSAMIWCFNVQNQLLQEDWPAEILQSEEGCEIKDDDGNTIYRGLSVRMGIHWGTPVCEPDIITRRMDYFGPMVNRTARVSAVADGGEITLTSDCVEHFKKIEAAYNKVQEGVNIEVAFADLEDPEILESQFRILKTIGWRLELYGKVQLKGLETEETISLIFPKGLASRYQFQRQPDLTSQDIHKLKDIVSRLDRTMSQLSGLTLEVANLKRSEHTEKQLFEVMISRLEHTIAMLALRDQTVGLFSAERDIFAIVEDVSRCYQKYGKIKAITKHQAGAE